MAISARWRSPPTARAGRRRSGAAGSGMPTSSSSATRASRASPADRRVRWARIVSGSWLPTVRVGIEAGGGVLEDDADASAAHRAQPARHRGPANPRRRGESGSPGDPAGRRHQPEQREGGEALAAARFADQRERLAARRGSGSRHPPERSVRPPGRGGGYSTARRCDLDAPSRMLMRSGDPGRRSARRPGD